MNKMVLLGALSAMTVLGSAQFVFAANEVNVASRVQNHESLLQVAQVSKTDSKIKKFSATKKTVTNSKTLKVNKALKATKTLNKKSKINLSKILKKPKSSVKKPAATLPGGSKFKVPTKSYHQYLPPVNPPNGSNVTPYQYVPPVEEPAEPTKTETHQQVIAPVDHPDSQQNSENSDENIIDLLKQVLAQNDSAQPDVPQTSMAESTTTVGEDEAEADDPEEVQLLKEDLEAILKIIKPEQNELILDVLEIEKDKAELGSLRLLSSYIRKYMESQVE